MIITGLQGIDVRAYHVCCGEQLESVVLVQTEANCLLIEIRDRMLLLHGALFCPTNCRKVYLSFYKPQRRMGWSCVYDSL